MVKNKGFSYKKCIVVQGKIENHPVLCLGSIAGRLVVTRNLVSRKASRTIMFRRSHHPASRLSNSEMKKLGELMLVTAYQILQFVFSI